MTPHDMIGNSFSVLYGQIGHQTPTELPTQVQCCCHCSHYGNMIMNLQQSVQELRTEVGRLQVYEREKQMTSNANNSNDANSCNNGSILYNGFTKEQLNCKIMSSKDFSKATKLLFKTMYTKEEIVGRSATGFSGRNAIDQQKKRF